MSAQKKVITIKGEELPISQCRQYNKLYYKIGDSNIKDSGDCYLINGKYYRDQTGVITYNYSINKYCLINDSIITGVVDIENNELIFGSFDSNQNYGKLIDSNSTSYYLFDASKFENNLEYRERLSTGDFYHISQLQAKKFNFIDVPSRDYKNSLNYDSKNVIDKYTKNYENYQPSISEDVEKYSVLLNDLSFGLEFETIKGIVPNRILNQYGLIPLRDGSISGIEYATVPMSGKKGLQTTVNILSELKKRTKYDDRSCSMHLHIGNLPRTKEFITAFFKVGMSIQDEMFEMFPLYKKYNYGIKTKNYTKPLPTFDILSKMDASITSSNIDKNFDVIYRYLSMGQSFNQVGNSLDNVGVHPADPAGNQKWNVKTRYHIFNLIPLIFGNKQTIEFRIHTPTYDENKIVMFMLMNSLLVNFVIRNQNRILELPTLLNNLNLYSILESELSYYKIENNQLFDALSEYIRYRINNCRSQTLAGNILGKEDDINIHNYFNWSDKKSQSTVTKKKITYEKGISKQMKKRLTNEIHNGVFIDSQSKHTVYVGNGPVINFSDELTTEINLKSQKTASKPVNNLLEDLGIYVENVKILKNLNNMF